MKKILFIVLIGVLFLFGCTLINKSIINKTVKEMKFKDNGKVTTLGVQEKVEERCKAMIYEPNEFVPYSAKIKYAYQDCMAVYGYTCIDHCAYEQK